MSFIEGFAKARWPHAEVKVTQLAGESAYRVSAVFRHDDLLESDRDMAERIDRALSPLPRARRKHPSRFWRKRR